MPNNKTSKKHLSYRTNTKAPDYIIFRSLLRPHDLLSTLKRKRGKRVKSRSFFLLKFYFVTMYQPAVDPDLNNDISIVRAVAMMCHQPYIEVIDTA